MAKNDNGELNRSIVSSNSNDPNNSLLKKVTKRVSGLFPSSLTKWFGNEGSQSTIRRRDSDDDSDDAEDISKIQPPKKRPKLPSDSEFSAGSSYTVTSTPLVHPINDLRHLQPGPSGLTRHTTFTTIHYAERHTENSPNIVNGDDKSDSGDSTSGYSSNLPLLNKESSSSSDRNVPNQPGTSKMSTDKPALNTSLNTTRSLFSNQSLNPQRSCLSARRPSFNASTFGSPSFVDRTLSTKRVVNSPFYSGRTIYGGASAYRRNRIIFPRDDFTKTAKRSVDIKPVNAEDNSTTNDSVNLSKTARRILDTLEHFSSPVLDAKKIPAINKTTSMNLSRNGPYVRGNKPASNKQLLVPTVPDLLQMKLKERLQNSTEQVRKVATTSKSILNTEYSIKTIEEAAKSTNQKHGGKMKSKVSIIRAGKNDDKSAHDVIDSLNLLPEVKLPITNLPKFDFVLPLPPPPPPPSVVNTTPIVPVTTTTSTSIISKPAPQITTPKSPSNTEILYKFSDPVIVTEISKSITSINNFKFSEPLNAKSNNTTSLSTAQIQKSPPQMTFKSFESSTAPKRKDLPKNNGQNADLGFAIQSSTQFVSGSVMDVLGKSENKMETNDESDNLMDKFKPAAGTWECSACLIRNISTATRCVACETLREQPKKQEPTVNFGAQFKMSASKWECSVCMVRNNDSDLKCVACTSSKPGSSTNATSKHTSSITTSTGSNNFSGFGDKFKPASDTWECSACMVRNQNDTVKCVACESPKPGAQQQQKDSAKPTLVLPPEIKTNSGFTDLIKKQQSHWECSSCMVRNPPEKTACVCCEAPKAGTAPTTQSSSFNLGTSKTGPQFKFGIVNKEKDSAQSGFKFGADSSTNTGFKFGIDKAENKSSSATFTFGIKPTEKSETTTGTNTVASSTTTGFTFGISQKKDVTTTKTPDKTSTSISASTTPKSTFTFGVQSTASTTPKSTINFGTAQTTASNIPKTTTNFITTQSSIASTSSAPKSTVGFGPAVSSTAPVFSFGSPATQTSTSITNKPTFAFGTSNTTVVSTSERSSTSTSVVSSSTTKTTSITFGTVVSTSTSTPSVTSSTSTTFNFGANKPADSTSAPLFNFGSSLPFNPPAFTTSAGTTNSTTPAFGGTTQNTVATTQSSFNFTPNESNNNKTDAKSFSFGSNASGATDSVTSAKPAAAASFSFMSDNKQMTAAAPVTKSAMFNFATNSNPENASESSGFQSNANNTNSSNATAGLFAFGPAAKIDMAKPQPTFGTTGTSMFGSPATQTTAQKPQNGGFNFGSSNVSPSFNFGAPANPSTTSTLFGFGANQNVNSSSTIPGAPGPAALPLNQPSAAAPASGGMFAFGSAAPTPTFNPDVKPNFNFSAGSIPSFSAQPGTAAGGGAMPQRRIRKAIRRTQQPR